MSRSSSAENQGTVPAHDLVHSLYVKLTERHFDPPLHHPTNLPPQPINRSPLCTSPMQVTKRPTRTTANSTQGCARRSVQTFDIQPPRPTRTLYNISGLLSSPFA